MALRSGLRRQQKKRGRLSVVSVIVVLLGVTVCLQVFGVDSAIRRFKDLFLSSVTQGGSADHVRGTIYDRNYKELAVSLPRVSVYARSRELSSIDAAANALAPVLDTEAGELLEKLRGSELRIWLARDISQQQETAVDTLKMPGIYLHKEHSRYYPQKETAAHLVGYVQDDIGLAGAEYYYDRLVQKMLSRDGGRGFRGGAGQHVLLTIDLKVQAILEKLVKDLSLGRQNVKIGAYAMDAGSGALVASVQFPSFDPNRYRIYSRNILENILVRPMLLPSVFQMIFRDSAAIQSQYESRGQVHPWPVSAAEMSLGGELRMWEKLGLSADPPQEFGNNETRLDRAAEQFVLTGKDEYDYGTVPESITPLNLLAGLSSLINGGKKVDPHIAQAVLDAESGEEYLLRTPATKATAKEVVSHEASIQISRMMAALGEINELGGATIEGTAQATFRSRDDFGHLSNELYFSAVPIEHAELTLLLTIQGGARQVPGKSAVKKADPGRELAEVLPRIAVLQEVGKSIAAEAEPTSSESGNYPVHLDKVREAVRLSLEKNAIGTADPGNMPDLVGLSLRKSLRLLQDSPCRIRIFGTGRVVSQDPKPGVSLVGVKECIIRMQRQEDMSLEALEEKQSGKK